MTWLAAYRGLINFLNQFIERCLNVLGVVVPDLNSSGVVNIYRC